MPSNSFADIQCSHTTRVGDLLNLSSSALRSGLLAMLGCLFSPSLCAQSGDAGAKSNTPKLISEAFESTTIRIDAKPGQVSQNVQWAFTNHWEIPLLIERIDTACGCLGPVTQAASVEKPNPVAPGESGVIVAAFDAGGNRGVMKKSLHVKFAGFDQVVELVIEAHVAAPIELSSQELVWRADQKQQTQTIDITTGTGEDFQITDLLGVAERLYTLTLETVEENRHFRIHITPTQVEAFGTQTLQVRTNARDPRDQLLAVFLHASQS